MKVVIAVDKFKGSLSAADVAAHLAHGLRAGAPGVEAVEVPVADGGDGTLDAALAAGYQRIPVTVSGPTGQPVDTAIAVRGKTAVVELAAACGLDRLPDHRLQPMTASSRGCGEAIAAALDHGCTTVVVGVGGSASTDGGAGLLEGLGVRFLDADGEPVPAGGAALVRVARIDLDALHPGLPHARLILASDVDNPLTGEHGAAAVYGPQKGASVIQVAELDRAVAHLVEVLDTTRLSIEALGAIPPLSRLATDPAVQVATTPGAGAAGGAGFAALLLGARFRAGIDVVLELVALDAQLTGADLVITGEGSLDAQSLRGKAPVGVARRAADHGVRTVAVAGQVAVDADQLRAAGIEAAYALTDVKPDVQRCIQDPGPLLQELARRVIETQLLGQP